MKKQLTGWELKKPSELLYKDLDKIEKFVKNYPLAALSYDKQNLFIIRKYQPSLNRSLDNEVLKNRSYTMGMAYYKAFSSSYFRFPNNLKYIELKTEFIDLLKETIIIETNKATIKTNVFELSKKLWNTNQLNEDEIKTLFLSLKNERNTTPLPKPITQTAIKSSILGEMQQDTDFNDWWKSKPKKLPWFKDEHIAIDYVNFNPNEDLNFIKEADETIKNILAMTEYDRLLASKYVYQNCMDFLESIGYEERDKPLWDMKKPKEVWSFVRLSSISIERNFSEDKKIYAIFYFECDWEDEHGLQLVFNNQAKLTRVSAIDSDITGWEGDGMITKKDL